MLVARHMLLASPTEQAEINEPAIAFIHIPRTGGTAIEQAGSRAGQHGLWSRSYALSQWAKGQLVEAMPGQPLQSCRLQMRRKKWPRVMWNDTCCSWWHLPMQALLPAAYYAAPVRFCVVRDPFTRLFSAYELTHGWVNYVNGSTLCKDIETHRVRGELASFRAWVEASAARVRDKAAWARHDCHLLPQRTYLAATFFNLSSLLSMRRQAATAALRSTGPGCNVVLRFEQLAREFNNLMKWAGLESVRLRPRVPRVSGSRGDCLSPAGVRRQLLASATAAEQLAEADAHLLGYPPLRALV